MERRLHHDTTLARVNKDKKKLNIGGLSLPKWEAVVYRKSRMKNLLISDMVFDVYYVKRSFGQ